MKKLLFLILVLFLTSVSVIAQQETQQDSTKTEKLDEVLVNAVRVNATSPITHSNINKEELEKRNLGQDLPILLNFLPSVVTTSDAGAGVGYTGIRVRGVSAQSTNITINGIPYNDSESQGTFWVNMPDFASSIENLQLQRGVGTSTNGAGAFGAAGIMLLYPYLKTIRIVGTDIAHAVPLTLIAGLGHYFGIDPLLIRLVWVLLIFGAGMGPLLYVILWILIPAANTTAEKLSMMGKPVNISNIEKKNKRRVWEC